MMPNVPAQLTIAEAVLLLHRKGVAARKAFGVAAYICLLPDEYDAIMECLKHQQPTEG